MTTPDDAAYENKPSDWNNSHAITLSISASEISGLFSNANGVSFGSSNGSITASIAAGGAPGSLSAGTTNFALGEVVFSNSNGVSFGLNGATVTATVQTNYLTTAALSNHSHGNPTLNLTNLSGTTASNSAGFTLSLSAGNYLTTAMASNRGSDFVQAAAAFAGTSASGTIASGGISVSIGPYITTAALSDHIHGAVAGGGGFGFQTLNFSDSNGISFGTVAGGAISASHNALTTGALSNHSHGNPTLALTNLSGTTASNSAGLTLSLSAADAGAANINFSAGTTSSNIGSVVFSNSNGVSFGLNGSTVTASVNAAGGGATISSYENLAAGVFNTTQSIGQSTSIAVAFLMPQAGSFGFLRIPVSMTTRSTTIASTASSRNLSAELYSTWNAVVYSMGVGASSKSLQSVLSASTGFTQRQSISVATNGTQYSVTLGYSAAADGGGTTRTTQYSASATNYSFTTQQIVTEWSGGRMLDIGVNNSLSAGPYWLLFGVSTNRNTTANTTLSAMTNCCVQYSNHFGQGQSNIAIGIMGSTDLASGGLLGVGSFTTAGGGTTASLPISAISSTASHVRPYFQLLRSA